jgi:hypothetical protein
MQNLVFYHGGRILVDISPLVLWTTVTWNDGTNARVPSNWPIRCLVDNFFTDILDSRFMDALRQTYSVVKGQTALANGGTATEDYTIGHGTFLGTSALAIKLASPPPVLDDHDIQTALKDCIANGLLLTSAGETCYFLVIPPDVTVTFQGDRSDAGLGGYHNSFPTANGQLVFYCVIPIPPTYNENLLTERISHELAEQITDPIPNTGWFGPPCAQTRGRSAEVCDCCSAFGMVHGYQVNPFVVEGTSLTDSQCGPVDDQVPRSNLDRAKIRFDKSLTRTSCLGSIIEGQSVFLDATASHRDQAAIIEEIQWSNQDQNQQILPQTGGTTQRIYPIIVPFGTTSVTVQAEIVTDLGCQIKVATTFPVVTQADADAQERVCELIDRIRHIYVPPPIIPPPIWGPERDFTVDPLTFSEIDQVTTSFELLGRFVQKAQPLIQEFAAQARTVVPSSPRAPLDLRSGIPFQ